MTQRISYIIGFASYLVVVSFLGWPNTFAFSQLSVESIVDSQTFSLVKSLFNTGAYFVVALWAATMIPAKYSSNALFAGAFTLTLVGSITTILSSMYPFWILIVLSAGIMGFGQALFFLAWQLVFARIDCEKPYLLPALATGLGALLYLSIVTVSTNQIFELVSVIFIPATGVFYAISAKGSEKVEHDGQLSTSLSALSINRSLVATLLVFVCTAFMWAMMRSYSSGPSITSDTLTVIGRLASAALIVVIYHYTRKQITVLSLFQFVFPILAIGFILLPVFNSIECNIIVSVFIYTAFSMMSIVAMVECRQLYLQEGLSPLISVGVAWGSVGVVTIFGRSIGALSVEFNFVITLVFIVIYVVFQIFFFSSRRSAHVLVDDLVETNDELNDVLQFSQKYGFTRREEEVFELLLKGRTSKQIADKLFVSNNTVLTHLKSIYRKVGVHSKTQIMDLFESEAENGLR